MCGVSNLTQYDDGIISREARKHCVTLHSVAGDICPLLNSWPQQVFLPTKVASKVNAV